ncbi:hypothetical protein G9C85_00645 [Halorubellus sp. JP-L1]|uniref:DUF7537 family lipoprotein n=1 Tax=Halorubellus sp. JP-L1 TaxID=2715753 RepID=UPI00140C0637|nr:hypothetical protein [Halorubellus sp. JP-L1]NHN40144.1 hypothetical protein [Halorubellus sp. JP-L1]
MTRRFATVLVVAVVVLAGCSGGPATSTTPDAATDSPTTTSETASNGDSNRVTVPSTLVAPGAGPRGIPNPRRLLQAHFASVSQSTYQSNLSYTRLRGGGAADDRATVFANVTRGPSGFANETRTVGNGTASAKRVYRSGNTVYAQTVGASGTTTEYGSGPVRSVMQTYRQPSQSMPSVAFLYFQLSDRMRPTGFDTRSGEKVVRYETTAVNETQFQRVRGVLGAPNSSLSDMSFAVYVDASGTIHDAEAALAIESADGSMARTQMDYRLRGVNDTELSTPAWTSEVTRLNGTLAANGTVLELENTGERTLSNHSVGVLGNVSAQTAVNRSLAPGETAYVYATGSENDTTLHVVDSRSAVESDARVLPRRSAVRAYVGSPNVSIALAVLDEANATATVRSSDYRASVGALGDTRAPSLEAAVLDRQQEAIRHERA